MKRECRYGYDCQRKNPEHWLSFSHPLSPTQAADTRASSSSPPPPPPENSEKGGPGVANIVSESNQVDECFKDPYKDETKALHGHENSRKLLVLIGLPGSGKSTFCARMLQSPARWIRICQDIISNGKSGSKGQCLKFAERSLNQGFNVIIDRCNLSKNQRVEFLELSRRLHAEAQALFLDLPAKVCIQRAMQRKGHEGGLEGKSAPAAIHRMAQSKELPSKDEGFSSIFTCKNDDDVEKAFDFFCRSSMNLNQGREASVHEELGDGEAKGKESSSDAATPASSLRKGALTLAFPSISTADFQFDHAKAADVIVEAVSDFLQKYGHYGVKLFLVDLKEDSDMLVRVNQKVAQRGRELQQFSTVAGDITKLHSRQGIYCNFIANASNWRLKAGGGGVNAAIFKAAGEGLESETKKRAKTLNPGTALVVPLPETSPLHVTEGVTHVIHVLGPNMNPLRPNYLQGNYTEGCRILKDAYSCMFEAFASAVETTLSDDVCRVSITQISQPEFATTLPSQSKPRNAFDIMMQSAKRRCLHTASGERESNEKQHMETVTGGCAAATGQSGVVWTGSSSHACGDITGRSDKRTEHKQEMTDYGVSKRTKTWASWSEALRNIAFHPDNYKDIAFQVTEEVVVISDKFPKARKHLLVIARKDGLDGIEDLRSSHLSLVQHMHGVGLTWSKSLIAEDASLVFRMGYHSEPSMRQLHMHVISQDFDSLSMKNKKHWNSFTSDFFRDSTGVIEELEKTGRVKPCGDEESLLRMELRCHKCRSVHPNIPRLKNHIRNCQAPFPTELTRQGYLITS